MSVDGSARRDARAPVRVTWFYGFFGVVLAALVAGSSAMMAIVAAAGTTRRGVRGSSVAAAVCGAVWLLFAVGVHLFVE